MALFTRAILAGEPIRVFNHGRMRRDFTYIDDIVEGVVRVLDLAPEPGPADAPDAYARPSRSAAPFRIYNIGNNTPVELERLIAAYITHDADRDRARTVREIVTEFRGLSGTAKQARVLYETGLARAHLTDLVNGDSFEAATINKLLTAMQKHSKPVKPAMLGVIGRDHFRQRFEAASPVEGGQVVVPADMAVADIDLGNRAPARALHHLLAPRGLEVDADFLDRGHAAGMQQALGHQAKGAHAGGVHHDLRHLSAPPAGSPAPTPAARPSAGTPG
jgi:hypothetical protein